MIYGTRRHFWDFSPVTGLSRIGQPVTEEACCLQSSFISHESLVIMRFFRANATSRPVYFSALLVIIVGCSSSTPLPEFAQQLVPVTGSVLFEGSPLTDATLVFHPDQQAVGETAYGVTTQDGSIEVSTYVPGHKPRPGIIPGRYIVTAFKLAMPDGTAIPKDMSEADAEAEGAKHVLPKVYQEATTSPLIVEIPADGGTITLELNSRARPRA